MPDQHALLSASGAHRWLNCPPSALVEAGLPDSTSAAAEQGTIAHALAEWKLRRALHLSPTMKPESTWIDSEMETLTDDYLAFVQERLREARKTCRDPVALIEQRVDYSHLVPGGFGTGDCVLIAEPLLQIIDFKYGQGVLVEAEKNPQLALYALGALHAFDALYEIDEVAVTIFQPRRSNVATWHVSVAGSWCRFCKIAPTCRTRAEKNLELAKLEFTPPPQLSDAEIAQVLAKLPELKKWASDVDSYALSLAVNQGKTWAGFKLVEGRSIRKYADETKVVETAQAAGINDIFERKLKTITALEKQLGKKRFSELLGDLVIKPPGKPALVPETDRRPALALSAAEEFKKIKPRKIQKVGK